MLGSAASRTRKKDDKTVGSLNLLGIGITTPRTRPQTLSFGSGGMTDRSGPDLNASYRTTLPKLDLADVESMMDPKNRYCYTARSLTHEERQQMKDAARNTYVPAKAP